MSVGADMARVLSGGVSGDHQDSTRWAVACDGLDAVGALEWSPEVCELGIVVAARSAEDAWGAAAAEGWTRRAGYDLCPVCTDAVLDVIG